MTNRTRSATLLGAACLVAVAGCGSDPKPKVLPSLSSTPSATATSTTSPGSVEAEVEAAVRHYFDVAQKAANTGNTTELESLSTPTCGCRQLVQSIKKTYAHGRSLGVQFLVHSTQVHDVRNRTAGAIVEFSVSAYRDVDESGRVVQTYEPVIGRDDMSWVSSQGRWLLTNEVRLEGPGT
jgi:predicted lipid-binding transport protein (Tim44 family)